MSSHRAPSNIHIGLLGSSPIGPLWVAVSAIGLKAVDWNQPQQDFTRLVQGRSNSNVIYDESRTSEPLRQISEYLMGERRDFDLPLDLNRMTAFQQQVLQLTSIIPYGQTSTYQAIAIQLGKPGAARAVGRVEATNPIPLVIPCHRVLGSDGGLHGYGGPGGIKQKAWLLSLEGGQE
ncbi:MAG: hypothetical protein A2136_07265 [Chloroflexi bacterium RBG_16_54_11]|nr:MAG: hypothetical protein A2136_07265 [Chloroflexi bacterium RBG_16_54_11]